MSRFINVLKQGRRAAQPTAAQCQAIRTRNMSGGGHAKQSSKKLEDMTWEERVSELAYPVAFIYILLVNMMISYLHICASHKLTMSDRKYI